MRMKTGPKIILAVLMVAGLVLGFRQAVYSGLIPRPNALKSLIPVKAEEIQAQVIDTNLTNVKVAPLPTTRAAVQCVDGNTTNCLNSAVQEIEIWAWNANGGLLFATGGAQGSNGKARFIQTSKGSLMEKYGVNVKISRQDDTNQMQTDLLDTAQKLASDPNASGVKFITIMGDGSAAFFQAINPKLQKVCPDCVVETIATIGYSRGEDGFWGPASWVTNCDAMKGGVVVGVLRDGDWNLALKKAGQCGVQNNPDDTVYDPEALNWINSDSYTKAANDFATGQACADLPTKGKLGSGKVRRCADAVVTWTPGDVTVAKNRGGVVPILTTQQSVFQMPCILVGIRKWNRSHREEIVNMLSAIYEGGAQMRVNPAAVQEFGKISSALYGEESPEYWIKYYRGVTETDAKGIAVRLGGSSVATLGDGLQSFGLQGGRNLYEATYNTFGKIVVQQYPNLVPTFPPVKDILDTSYVQAVASKGQLDANTAENVIVASDKGITKVEGKRDYSIQFATGSAEILPSSIATMNQIADDILITNYIVAVHGHTDNTGTPDGNIALSEARAKSVIAYLKQRGAKNNFRPPYAHGQDQPVASNATAEGRAKNRRVQIVLGE